MTRIFSEADADATSVQGADIAIVGYGNQGRSWALNLRDSGLAVRVCVRADDSRAAAEAEGFATSEIRDASRADILCVLIPDDVIPLLGLEPGPDSLTILASGYAAGFDRFHSAGDVAMIAPRMLGPEVRRCFEEGGGFITAIGVSADVSGRALERTLGIALALGGLREGAIEMTPHQEAVLDLAVEQVLSPALAYINQSFVGVMLENGIPLEAILTELVLSGEIERTYGLLRTEGFARQMEHHSPTSQYGQLSRRGSYDHLDVTAKMREMTAVIADGRFADEWDGERDAGHPALKRLKKEFCGPAIRELEDDLRRRLGPAKH
jgi:ketol-acid reductoisomerase